MPNRTILILGGTQEAATLAERLAGRATGRIITSLAGRTRRPATLAGETRIGGFGGVDGLSAFIRDERIDLMIDATHPFATRISENAAAAAQATGIRHIAFVRPPWTPDEGDRWHDVASLEDAAAALPAGARAFLALGSQHLDAFSSRADCHFVVRMVDRPAGNLPLASFDLVVARPGPDASSEATLLGGHAVSHVVCRNSGGNGARAKLDAARGLGLEIIMTRRPPAPDGKTVSTLEALEAAIG